MSAVRVRHRPPVVKLLLILFLRPFSIVAAAHLVLGVAALRALQLGLIFALGEPLSLFGFLCGGVGRGRVSRLVGHVPSVARTSGLACAYCATRPRNSVTAPADLSLVAVLAGW